MLNRFHAVIIETSAICNLRCKMCPTLSYQNSFGVMKDKVFNKIIDDIQHVELIALEGWGEPFLDKKIIKRIKKSNTKAKIVGITSNATLINDKIISKLKDSGLDKLNISIDGGSKEVYEKIRIGADFDKVFNNIKKIKESNINVSLTCVITKMNYKEINKIVQLANDLDVFELHLKPNDVISSEDMLDFSLSENELIETYNEAKKYIHDKSYNIQLHAWNIFKELYPKNNCLANPLDGIFINYKGEVSPCCNLGHPVPRVKKNKLNIEKMINTFLSYGNIMDENIYQIWDKQEYVNFRDNIYNRILPLECRFCNLF